MVGDLCPVVANAVGVMHVFVEKASDVVEYVLASQGNPDLFICWKGIIPFFDCMSCNIESDQCVSSYFFISFMLTQVLVEEGLGARG